MTSPFLIPNRPVPLAAEIAAMPLAYQAMVGDMEGRIQTYYRNEISALRGDAPDISASLDRYAGTLLDLRFPRCDLHYGYMEVRPSALSANAYTRVVGILPPGDKPVRGTIFDVRGYGHALEYDLERTADFVDAGFAVFTQDRLEHGLSSRIDPRNAAHRSVDVFVAGTLQGALQVGAIRRHDPRLSGSPFYGVASSLGGAQLLGALRAAGSSLGFDAVILDSPLLTFGSKHPWAMRRVTALLFGALGAFPETLSEVKAFYPKRSAPARLPKMSDELFDRITRYAHAFGPRYHPVAMNGLEELLLSNQNWLRQDAKRILPRTMMTVAESDTELDPKMNTELFRAFARSGDAMRETSVHNTFVQRDDENLVPDIIDFLEGRYLL